ncbi:ATP-dependent DNA helicase UvrD2 [Corynebacterium sp. TAE3-ERU12]|uniref:ATP-dependent DNA helicase UvrD2 n=1 Tax=Corynebacterium sp. TAE3-ERU12 TaxID=2849491 RepID=UPI001C454D8D|nr:ATP-dependent DNA helicase UvrD2 [Corynebacterium sp. TAE3-ERU12]MBV7294845.1 ATP-dependent DNA helicase UvrD2 [Corynebacterium sp. TAE3-ERU12]
MPPANLTGLDPEQLTAATAPLGPVRILAGAGTGKTRTITHRIYHLIDQGFVGQNKILAVTFTSRAAGEMRDRLARMGIPGVQARTFHSAALRQLRYFWPQIAGDLQWKLLDNKFPVVARASRAAGIDASKETVRDVLGEIEWAKATLVTPDNYAAKAAELGRPAPVDADKIAKAYRGYEELKTSPEGMLLDFDDLLLHTAGAMENSRAVAEEFRNQYRSFVVDEYQDVTPLQQRVLDAWLGERDDLTVVGDPNQTIYSFTGATPRFLMDFPKRFPNATQVRLERDYRSTPQVVELANLVISKASGALAGSGLELYGQRPAGPEPTFTEYTDEPTEARVVAKRIRRLLDSDVPANEIAILYRVNAQSVVFEQALSEAGIPYQVRGGEGFYQRQEIRDAIAALIRVARQQQGTESPRGGELVVAVRQVLQPLGLTEEEPEGAKARERWQSLGALADLCEELVHINPDLDITGLLGQLRTRSDAKQPPTIAGVTLASLHAAKGLEWDAVFLVGLTDGTLPIQHAVRKGDTSEDVEEERRLLYVGITRAREHLELSWALSRQEGGRTNRTRSRFLNAGTERYGLAQSAPTKRKKSTCRNCGATLKGSAEKIMGRCSSCPSTADPELVEALRQWRLEMSKEMSVPAFVVFSDATLIAIAEAQPTDLAALLMIPGIGEIKANRYGESLLQLLASR